MQKLPDELRYQAAALRAAGKKIVDIAKDCGVSEKTIDRWINEPEWQPRVDAELAIIRARIAQEGLALKENRILAKRRRHLAITKALKKRAGNPQLGGAEWDESGFFVQRQKMIGGGDSALMITEYELDTGALGELNELEDGIAREKGDHKISIEIPKPKQPEALVILAKLLPADQLESLIKRAEAQQHDPRAT